MNLNEWQKVELGEVVDINSTSLSNSTPPDFEFKYIDLSSVETGRIDFPDSTMNFRDAPSRARRIFKKDDVLMSTVRPNLQAFVYIDFNSENYIASTGFAVLRSSNKIDPNFLYQNLYSQDVSSQINGMLVGSNYPAINSSDVASIIIPLPPLAEQKRIAEVLGVWDEGIEDISKVIALKEQQKKGLMQRILTGKTRLPGFNLPWKEVRLGEIGECIRGVTYKREEDLLEQENDDSMILLRSTNIQKNKIIFEDIQVLPKDKARKKQFLKNKDIVICMANGSRDLVGKSAQIANIDMNKKITVGAFCSIFRAKDVYTNIINFLFQSDKYRRAMAVQTAGSSIGNLSGSDVESIKMKIPSDPKEQSAIAAVLSEADNEISLLKQKLELFKQQKKWLMQQLLTGKKRLNIQKEN